MLFFNKALVAGDSQDMNIQREGTCKYASLLTRNDLSVYSSSYEVSDFRTCGDFVDDFYCFRVSITAP